MKQIEQFIYGRNPVLEALEEDKPVDKVLLQQGTRGELEIKLRHLCKQKEIPLQVVPKERLERLVRGNHQGVIALLTAVEYQKLEDLLPWWMDQGIDPLLVLLDGVTDVRNVGAIARSAEVLGAHAIILPAKGGAALNADAVKTSAGALLRIPVCRHSSLMQAITLLKESGVRVVCTALHAQSTPIHNADLLGPLAIIMGSEDTGVNQALIKAAHQVVHIPQLGKTESLNVSVATSIVLYESLRQRTKLPPRPGV